MLPGGGALKVGEKIDDHVPLLGRVTYASARAAIASALVELQLNNVPASTVVHVLEETRVQTISGVTQEPLTMMDLPAALSLAQATKRVADTDQTDNLLVAVAKAQREKLTKPIRRSGTIRFNRVIGLYPVISNKLSPLDAEIQAEIEPGRVRGYKEWTDQEVSDLVAKGENPIKLLTTFGIENGVVLVQHTKVVAVFTRAEFDNIILRGQFTIDSGSAGSGVSYTIDFDADGKPGILAGDGAPFGIAVGNNALRQEDVWTKTRSPGGTWSAGVVGDLTGVYADPTPVAKGLADLQATGLMERLVDGFEVILGKFDVPIRVVFRSGHGIIGESAIDPDGTLVLTLDAQAALSPDLVAVMLAHELLGHGVLQHLTLGSLSAEGKKKLTAFRSGFTSDVEYEVFAEVFSHVVSAELFVDSLHKKSKDAIYTTLLSESNLIDFRGRQALNFLGQLDALGEARTPQAVMEGAIRFVQQAYYHNDSGKVAKQAVLATMLENSEEWIAKIQQAQELLGEIIASTVNSRDGPLRARVEESIAKQDLATQGVLRHALSIVDKDGKTAMSEAVRTHFEELQKTEQPAYRAPER